MNHPDIGIYLLHIADSCEKILRYLQNMEQDAFFKDEMVQDAVARNFEIIGEAAKHVPDEYRRRHPAINWRGMTVLPETLEQITSLPEHRAARDALA